MTWSIKEPRQKLRRAPTAPYRLTCLSKACRRLEKKIWMEDRRRRRIAFENLAMGMLRYLDNADDVIVGITELQERVEVLLHFGISIQQVAQLARRQLVPIRCQSGIDLTSCKHCQPCDSSKTKRIQLICKNDKAIYSSSWWNWQESWWHSSYEHHHDDGPCTD